MQSIKLSLVFFLLLTATYGYAQDKKYAMSAPIAFSSTGWNKVLCIKNGNTMLFHFDPGKPIVITVFDSTHKQIAKQDCDCRVLDLSILRASVFKGLFEINGEAVLFIQQEHLSKQGLVRLRFNSKTGKLTEEKRVGESPGIGKKTEFYVMHNAGDDKYAILFSTDIPQFSKCEIHVSCYNNRHESIKEIPVEVERDKYDYLQVIGAEEQPNGILISLDLLKMVMNGTSSPINPQSAIYNRQIAMYYIPDGSDAADKYIVDAPSDFFPYYSLFTNNLFDNTSNLLVYSYRGLYYRFGFDVKEGSVSGNLFFKLGKENDKIKYEWLNNDLVNDVLKQKTGVSSPFSGFPLAAFTDDSGLTTIITEGYDQYDGYGIHGGYSYQGYYKNIGITQLDNNGNEVWGTILAHSENYTSYWHYYGPIEIAREKQSHAMFDDLPEQITDRQFISLNSYRYKNNFYLMFNDDAKNFSNKVGVAADVIYNFENTNACYYKINSRKEVTKNYLLGTPGSNEYKCSFIEGADFDQQRGVYATLVQYKLNNKITLRMAWRSFD